METRSEHTDPTRKGVASLMDMNLGGDVMAKLAALTSDFARSLDTIRDQNAELLTRIRIDEDVEGAVREIGMLAHRLRGTAPTFGFDELGTRAAALEDSVQRIFSPHAPVDATVREFIDAHRALMREIRAIVAQQDAGA